MSKYDTQFKLAVVQDYLKNRGERRIARLYDVNPKYVTKWALAYQAHGLASL